MKLKRKNVISIFMAVTIMLIGVLPAFANDTRQSNDVLISNIYIDEVTFLGDNEGLEKYDSLDDVIPSRIFSDDKSSETPIFVLSDYSLNDVSFIDDKTDGESENPEYSNDNTLQGVGKNEIAKDIESTTKASAADVSLSNLSTSYSQPLQIAQNIPFTFKISNNGGSAANNLQLSFYCDDQLVEAFVIGSVPAGASGTVTLHFVSSVGGRHSIKIVANENRSVTESNYNNNTVVNSFTWVSLQQYVDLGAYAMGSELGTTFESNQTVEFIFAVVNYGTKDVYNAPVHITVSGITIGEIPASVQARTIQNLRCYLTFARKGVYTVGLSVDPQNTSGDVDMTDNKLYNNYNITYDSGEQYAAYWASTPNSLKVYVRNTASLATLDEISAASQRWNSISTNVNFSKVAANVSELGGGYDIIVDPITTAPEVAAFAAILNGNVIVDESSNESYSLGLLALNRNGFLPQVSKTDRIGILAHEFGHLLGLDHTTCGDYSIMAEGSSPLWYANITEHDKYVLRDRYN